MKKLYLFICLIPIVFYSCAEDFSPKSDFKKQYIMYAVWNVDVFGNSGPFKVMLSSTYDVDGYNPNTNTVDPTIANAQVSVTTARSGIFELEQDTSKRNYTSRYQNPSIYYSVNNPKFALYNRELMTLKAVLPNGTVLTGSATVPNDLTMEYSYDFSTGGVTPYLDKFMWGDHWDISWDNLENGHLFFPKLLIMYSKKINDSTEQYGSKEIPIEYVKKNGGYVAVYPSPTFDNKISYSFDAMDRAMMELSDGEPNKSLYTIRGINLQIVDYCSSLGNYFSSVNGSLDEFSIRLDETTYSNISGGLGVFGISKTSLRKFFARRAYAEKYGYNVIAY